MLVNNSPSIWHYTLSPGDAAIRNPYLDRVLALTRELKSQGAPETDMINSREELICEYAFSIPYHTVLQRIAHYSPLVEIGAGNGYWAWCLSQSGTDIIAYDSKPPMDAEPLDLFGGNRWFHDEWVPVTGAGAAEAGNHPDRSLFLAWPEPWSLMASEALYAYTAAGGKTLVYIGDPASSGDDIFHETLAKYRLVHSEKLWGWPGIGDSLFIYSLSS